MRYNFSPSLWILVYVIFVWPYKRYNCNDICKNPEIVIIENDTYRYSLHYNYSMRIQRYQSQPAPSESFKNKINFVYEARPQFSFSYYGSHVQKIYFYESHRDDVYVFGRSYIGIIYNYMKNYKKFESRILNEKELLGVKRNFSLSVNGAEIPTEIKESDLQSKIYGLIRCDNVSTNHEIPVPAKWIKSGTLVVFEEIGEICSQYNTNETCQNAKTSNTTCIWCEKGKKCIESNNQDTHGWKVNDCHVEIEYGYRDNGRK
uniref:Egg protein CP391S-like protein n=1 Tax=Schistosoma mansoni TaxID=6183 RepID=A0AA82N8B7_SCHMA